MPSKTRHLNESQENIDPFREVKLAQDCFNTVKFLVSSSIHCTMNYEKFCFEFVIQCSFSSLDTRKNVESFDFLWPVVFNGIVLSCCQPRY